MIQKNLTPFQFGPVVTSLEPPQPQMSCVVVGMFSIAPGKPLEAIEDRTKQPHMSGDTWADDDIEFMGSLKHCSDLAPFKLRTDVMLLGTCYVPKGVPVDRCPVAFAVGEWQKQLLVIGARSWQPGMAGGYTISPAARFTQMPLTWENAYGGEKYDANPVGKGHSTLELPNIEIPGKPLTAPASKVPPAGFGPINPNWVLRKKKMGRNYGKEWRRTRMPWVSDDFDWSFYNAAPEDQQLPERLRGNETLRFQNLHPEAEVFEVQLPGLQPRVFIKYDDDHVEEPVLELDTLIVDLDKGILRLGWRGVVNVADEDMLDAKYALVGSEPIDAPQTDEYWKQQLDEFTADPLGLKKAGVPELDEPPGSGPQPPKAPIEVKPDGQGTPMEGFMQQQMGGVRPDLQAQIEAHLNEAAKGWASGGGMPMGFNEAMAGGMANASPAPPSPFMAIQTILAKMATMKVIGAQHGVDVSKIDAAMKHPQMQSFGPADPNAKPDIPADAVSADKPGTPDAYKDAAPPEADPNAKPPGAEPPKEGEQRDYSGQDFSGQDLSGRDFTNCKLIGCNFSKAIVAGVPFTGSDLLGAVMYEVAADGADFSDCNMENVIGDRGTYAGATFIRAQMKNAGFYQSKMTGVVLDEAKCERTRFMHCDLTSASAAGLVGDITLFDSSTMAHVSFVGATLYKASFHFATATDLDFTDADLRELQGGMECDFSRCRFERTLASKSIWRGANLTSAKFIDSDFEGALMVEANLTGVIAQRCDFAKAILRKARLSHAQFFECRFMRALLPKAVADNCTFLDCNLWQAVLIDADLETCKFAGTPLTHTIRRDS
ncbi:MAG: DUF2169 domain-containing protein [Planctomycetota bacterium]